MVLHYASWFFTGYLIFIIILFNISYTKNKIKGNESLVFEFSSMYIFTILGILDKETFIINEYTISDIKDWFIGIAVIIGFIGILKGHKSYEYNELENRFNDTNKKLETIKIEYYKLCSDIIKELFDSFFSKTQGQGRVSIYKYDENKSKFKLLGRYSNCPEYNKIGREGYSSDEGFIAEGWKSGKCEIFGIPKWTGNGKAYKDFVKSKCKISENTLKSIKMKSCAFYISRIENEDSRLQLGIIVFEQIQSKQIDSVEIDNILEYNKIYIRSLIKSIKIISS